MSTPKRSQNKKQCHNRQTSNNGSSNQRAPISVSFVLVAVAFMLVLYWTKGDLGQLLGGSLALPTLSPSDSGQQTPSTQNESDDESPTAEATATRSAQKTPTPASTRQARATATATANANAPPVARASDLPTIAYDALPPEAHDTIALIEEDGLFPFSRDGITFQNRERLLPRQPEGYYREYTVITPNENDRGARRIVTGDGGEMYYTSDHYESFSEIIR
jgi:ribonuclease T1